MHKLLKNIKGVKKTLNKKYGKSTVKNILFVVGFLVVLVIGVYLGKLLNKTREGFEGEGDGFFSSDAIMSVKDMDLSNIQKSIENNKKAILGELEKLDDKDTAITKNKTDIGNIDTTMKNLNTENLTPGSIIPYFPKNNTTTTLSNSECIELLMKGFIPCDINVFGTFNNDEIEITKQVDGGELKIGTITKDDEFITITQANNIIAKIPNLSRRFIVGAGTANGTEQYDDYYIGTTGGEEMHTLTIKEMPSHDHDLKNIYIEPNGYHWKTDNGNVAVNYNNPGNRKLVESKETGDDQPHENRPPFMAMVYIYYLGSDYRYMENTTNYELMKGIADSALA
jgi:hypothetical protein